MAPTTPPQSSPLLQARALALAAGVRSDSRMYLLSLEHFETLLSLVFCQRVAPQVALAMMVKEGIPKAKLPGLSQFYQFLRDFSPFYNAMQRRMVAKVATETAEEASRSPVDWFQANAEKIGRMTFEALSDPTQNPEKVKGLITSVIKIGKLNQDAEKLALLRKKLELAEQKEAAARAALEDAAKPDTSDAERKQIVARVYEMLGAGKPPEAKP